MVSYHKPLLGKTANLFVNYLKKLLFYLTTQVEMGKHFINGLSDYYLLTKVKWHGNLAKVTE